ncbi:D-alanyl-D-alanine carboxypeptidase family protein [uncultured Eubacterium sp.]|uniref:D-alanyl-D-alanine carboxypeptidase family protein n=1 Tax=uncultured Eubacterium sp. TaxID=165185 RepID=UPI002620BC12|nr:D-alanyl-D-alanine carboxypeptidase family protein [uncultured Eubacterium sp.]
MKKIIALILAVTMLMNVNVYGVQKEEEESNVSAAKSSVLMEASSGTIIKAENENEKLSPASITKIMTLILIFDSIHSGKIKLTDMVTTSAHAKSMGGSQVFLEEGEQQPVETMIKCIIIASGNDASVAMAEHVSGSEEEFVKKMNERAKGLGMNNTNFEDCCGLTDSDNHYTSAKDVAIMSRELITKYPEIFKYSTIWMEPFTHKTAKGESEFMLSNTNKLLKTNQYVKGLKTGSTSKAKYCVSTVAEKDGVELIAVIMAAPDYKARFSLAEQLIKYGFSNCKVFKDKTNYRRRIDINGGKKEKVLIDSAGFSYVDTKGQDLKKIKKSIVMRKHLTAPLKKGEVVGKISYLAGKKVIGETELVAKESVEKSDYVYTFKKMVSYLLGLA